MAFLRLLVVVFASVAFGLSPVEASPQGPGETSSWDHAWQFILEPPDQSQAGPWALDDVLKMDKWENVDLPHYGQLETYESSIKFQGFCWYRETFTPDSSMKGKAVTLEFGAGMQVADVWVDGRHVLTHEGGYLPFTIDLTQTAAAGKPAMIVVRLDNRDNPDVPPGKPLNGLDFDYFSGLYRDVWLHVSDPLHISDSVLANQVAGGGVFVRYENVSEKSADVLVATDVRNEGPAARNATVLTKILDADHHVVAQDKSTDQSVAAGQDQSIAQTMRVADPKLWSIDQPHLYTLVSQVMSDGKVVDTLTQHIGLRTLRSDPKLGFFLNGRHLAPSGTNRHQAFPYVGNAGSDEAQYRDALKLKEDGFQIIRLSHYPQSPAFLDACDELGLLTIVCIPGWQFFHDTDHFKSNVEANLRDVIRRDRNHPSCILWETSLNETDGHDDFFRHLVEVAHQEYPGDQMLTCGDTEGHDFDAIRYDVPYSGWDGTTRSRPSRAHGDMSFHREYGDSQFGAYSRYTRGDGEKLMLIQVWNYQTALNQQNELPYTWGQCSWEGIDNTRGMSSEMATCGALDLFRLPKFMAYFYQSQRDPRQTSPLCRLGPMVYIANYWTPNSPSPVVVYSNADEVELFVNGKSQGRRQPDGGPDVAFGDSSGFDLNYWQKGIAVPLDERKTTVSSPVLTGGNARHLVHPPFTFPNVSFMPGVLKAVAYLDGKPVATAIRRTPGAAKRLALVVDYSGKKFVASGADIIFVHAEVRDEHGTIVPDASPKVTFTVEGPATIVGDKSRAAEAGIATAVLRSTTAPGTIKIHAQAEGLEPADGGIESIPESEATSAP
jgi:beta-galactosidase